MRESWVLELNRSYVSCLDTVRRHPECFGPFNILSSSYYLQDSERINSNFSFNLFLLRIPSTYSWISPSRRNTVVGT